ncbi:MAG TPA: acetyl-coenzyme A synthetase N-terminal domain-containing protein, partial [Thermoanaerobaculia bacterium]|nr:acetyl-coenzyme A synthetase N-terminal domain-containing protein [Thermoanaerobaculia bacterium]
MTTIPVKPDIAAGAHINSMEEYQRMYRRSIDDPQGFWREQAENYLDWFHPPRNILDVDKEEVDFNWFSGGRLNACFNCVDRHLENGKGDKTAIIWAADEPGEYRYISYREVKHQVSRIANVLLSLGVQRGDRVCIY